MSIILEVRGEKRTQRVELEVGEVLTVGRTEDCDIVLVGNSVSRTHCRLETLPGGAVQVTNLSSSKGGTAINGDRVKDPVLAVAGDEIEVGEFTLVVSPNEVTTGSRFESDADEWESDYESDHEDSEDEERRARPRRKRRKKRKQKAPAGEARSREKGRAKERERDKPSSKPKPKPEESRQKSPAELEAAAKTEAFLAQKQAEARKQSTTWAIAVVLLAMIGGGVILTAIQKLNAPRETADQDGDRPGLRERTPRQTEADATWARLMKLGDGATPAMFQLFADEYPEDERAVAARLLAEGKGGGAEDAPPAERALLALQAEAAAKAAKGKLAQAHALYGVVIALAPASSAADKADEKRAELAQQAGQAVATLKDELTLLTTEKGAIKALLTVFEKRTELAGLGQDDQLEALVKRLERDAERKLARAEATRVRVSSEATTLEQEAMSAAIRFDFAQSKRQLDELLVLGLSDEMRLKAHWTRREVDGLEALYDELLALAKGPRDKRPTLTIRGELRGRLIGAKDGEAILEPILQGTSGEVPRPWSSLAPSQVLELCQAVDPRSWPLARAKAYFAFQTGLTYTGVEILIPFARRKSLQAELFSFYAIATGTPLPEGGLVLFEGKFISPAKRDEILAERERIKLLARRMRQQAKEEKAKTKVLARLDTIEEWMNQGHYHAGRQALAWMTQEYAEEYPDIAATAQARLDSPLLRRRDMRESLELGQNGRSDNRFDVYFMGDGFTLDPKDAVQKQFDNYANQAMKFCQNQDFFKEYDGFINYWAVNLISQDDTLTRDGEEKDTALQGQIDDGRYTIQNRSLVHGYLDQFFPGEHDRQMVGIGNDFASVATGGGGVVACAKTMLGAVPHEIGHAFGGLGDEYDFEPGGGGGSTPPPAAGYVAPGVVSPNVVTGSDRGQVLDIVPWQAWLDQTGGNNWSQKEVGIFEGANRQPKNFWRPQRSCVMRDVGSPFCVVCMEIMMLKLYRLVSPIEEVWPKEQKFVYEGKRPKPQRFMIEVLKPATHDIFVHWRIKKLGQKATPTPDDPDATRTRDQDDEKETDISGKLTSDGSRYIHYVNVDPDDLEPGFDYELSAEVWDPTDWVRDENRTEKTGLRVWQRWTLRVPKK